MSNELSDDVIDLTNSLSFTLADHCAMSNIIIDLDTDESFYDLADTDDLKSEVKLNKPPQTKRKNASQCQQKGTKTSEISKRKENPFGECPICWDELGKRPLASTKCGHVYCLKCLERSLQHEKKCPTCRSNLKGKAAYHPLYLFKN